MRSANHTSKLKGNPQPAATVPSKNPTMKSPRDAREDKSKLKQNRKELGVEEDHKTTDMEKTNRGTFP